LGIDGNERQGRYSVATQVHELVREGRREAE
jgi:hypothetical protein